MFYGKLIGGLIGLAVAGLFGLVAGLGLVAPSARAYGPPPLPEAR